MGSLWRHPRRSAYAGGTEPSRLDTRWKRVDAGDTFDTEMWEIMFLVLIHGTP